MKLKAFSKRIIDAVMLILLLVLMADSRVGGIDIK